MRRNEIISKLTSGARVDRYKIVKRVAKGVFAQVFLAEDTELGRNVVLRFNRLLQPVPRFERRIKDAARTLASLHHAHLLAVYDIGTCFDLTYVVCEYAPRSLASEITNVATPDRVDWVCDVMANISRAVDYVHRRGLVHRNVNPTTIRIDANGQPKLASFELAVHSEEVPEEIAGTPEYMSPEQITGDTQTLGPATDVWAIGATTYHALAGRPPFQGKSVERLKELIVEGEPLPLRQFNSLISEHLQRVCLKCLSKSPAARYSTAEDVAREFSEGGTPPSPVRQRVFVSHSSLDREFVQNELIASLENHSIDTWYSMVDIQTAAEWERSILSGLESCALFLIVMSPNSVRSEWVKDELFWAIENRIGRIVPVMIADCEPREFHMRLARIEHVDFRDDPSQARARLVSALRDKSGAECSELGADIKANVSAPKHDRNPPRETS